MTSPKSESSKAKLMEAQQAIGQKVRRLRLKKGWTQEEFADRCAIDCSHMSAIERGETNLAFSTLYTLTYYLDITIYDLLRRDYISRTSFPSEATEHFKLSVN